MYLHVYTILTWNLSNNMAHARISGTELSSVILDQTKLLKKLQSDEPKCQNKLSQNGLCKKPTKV